jgi:hypothetical protein
MTPVRIQLKRSAGFRLQAVSQEANGLQAVKVDRTTKWGNPHRPEDWHEHWPFREKSVGEVGRDDWCRDRALEAFREDIAYGLLRLELSELRGKNLACWCKPTQRCHADILLELANK